MSSPSIKTRSEPVLRLLNSCRYEVPGFQRPYAWEKEQLSDYWNDVPGNNQEGDSPFLGTIVAWVSEQDDLSRNTYALIDGQQRLTTITICLTSIRDAFENLASEQEKDTELYNMAQKQSINTQNYILAENDNTSEIFPILNRSESYFSEKIQHLYTVSANESPDASTMRLQSAKKFFDEQIDNELNSLNPKEKYNKLLNYRNRILGARLIQVDMPTEEDAFVIFETLNARGAELRLRDLVKNALVRKISPAPLDRKNAVNRWDRVMDQVVGEDSNHDAADLFIWQSWNSRRPDVKKIELYKPIKGLISKDSSAALSYLEELETDASPYALLSGISNVTLDTPKGERKALKLPEIQQCVRALELFNVSVANSAILALIRKYDSTNLLRKRTLITAAQSIENYHFQFTHLTTSSSTGGTRGRYNRFAVELEIAETVEQCNKAVSELVQKLHRNLPNRADSESGFRKIFYAPSLTLTRSQKKYGTAASIRYIFLTMASRDGLIPTGKDDPNWTIEHISPQKDADRSIDDFRFQLGNLTLLTAKINQEAEDGNFTQKRSILHKYALLKDHSLSEWIADKSITELDNQLVKSRTESLIQYGLDKTWAIKM